MEDLKKTWQWLWMNGPLAVDISGDETPLKVNIVFLRALKQSGPTS